MPRFDGDQAMRHVRALVDLGNRAPGSEGHRRAQDYITAELQRCGRAVVRQEFRAGPLLHAVDLANLVSPPEGLPKVVLGTHYDTIRLKGGTFVGANDGASGVGVLLELARVLPEAPLELVFFDGEETLGGAPSGLHGSRHYVRRRPEAVAAAIVVDMVGDRDLRLCREQFSSATLLDRLFAIGRDLGYATVLTGPELKVEDDHVPFLDAGLEAALLLDYGDGAGPGQPPYWHTLLDTLDNLAPGSLEAVGRILYEYGQSLDR